MNFIYFLITLLFAFAAGLLCHRLKMPAGAMVGAIIGVIALNLVTADKAYFYSEIKTALQILSGAMIGARIGKQEVMDMKQIILPTLFLLAAMVLFNIVFGALIYILSPLDAATALFSTAPGGVSDMALIAAELGANEAYVGILQIVRLLVIFSTMPSIFRRILTKHSPKNEPANPSENRTAKKEFYTIPFLLMVVIAAFGGLLFKSIGISAGALIGAMIASGGFCIVKGKQYFPNKLRVTMKVLAGAYIARNIGLTEIRSLPLLGVPVIIMLFGILLFVFLVSYIMYKLFNLDLAVCLLSSTPGGIQEMSLLSEELGADTPKVAVMQSARIVFVIAFFPVMIKMLVSIFGI